MSSDEDGYFTGMGWLILGFAVVCLLILFSDFIKGLS